MRPPLAGRSRPSSCVPDSEKDPASICSLRPMVAVRRDRSGRMGRCCRSALSIIMVAPDGLADGLILWFDPSVDDRRWGVRRCLTRRSRSLRRQKFFINDEHTPIIDVSRRAFPDAPPEAQGAVVLLCPHCGHDERGNSGPHEVFDTLSATSSEQSEQSVIVSDRHFRCRECGETSPVWVLRRDKTVNSHMREAESGDPCVPAGFHGTARAGEG